MKLVIKQTAIALLAVMLAGSGFALYGQQDDEHPLHPYIRHDEWKKGYHMQRADWQRGEPLDSHRYRLPDPPRGYQWRELDGNFVMAQIATGIVASVIVPPQH